MTQQRIKGLLHVLADDRCSVKHHEFEMMFENQIVLTDETYSVPRYVTDRKHESSPSTALLMTRVDTAETGRQKAEVQKTSAGPPLDRIQT